MSKWDCFAELPPSESVEFPIIDWQHFNRESVNEAEREEITRSEVIKGSSPWDKLEWYHQPSDLTPFTYRMMR